MTPSESTPREQPANEQMNTDTDDGKVPQRAEEIRIKVEDEEETVWNRGARWEHQTPVPPRPLSNAQLMMLGMPLRPPLRRPPPPSPSPPPKAVKEPAQPRRPPKPTPRMSCGPSRRGRPAKVNAGMSTLQKPCELPTMTTGGAAARRELAKNAGSKRARLSEPEWPAAGPSSSAQADSEEEAGKDEEPIAGPSR